MKVTDDLLLDFAREYDLDPTNRAVEGAISTVGVDAAAHNAQALRKHTFEFSVSVDSGEITNQKKSGRCWIFATFNSLRPAVQKKLNVKSFEFSQSYLYFYDKLEKANTFLTHVSQMLDMPDDDRLFRMALDTVGNDGGDWDYSLSLIRKWGAVPSQVMPDTENAINSARFDEQMATRLRSAASQMRHRHDEGADAESIDNIHRAALADIYTIVRKALGEPPREFNYEYTDKDDHFHRLSGLTPHSFVRDYIGEEALNERVVIGYDPRSEHPFGRVLRLPFLTSVYEGSPLTVLNVPIEDMKEAVISSLKEGKAVYFGCDVGRDTDRKLGIMDPDLFRWDDTLAPVGEFSVADRARYRETIPTHAMTFLGVNLDDEGHPLTWKVENSWGEDVGKKGIYSMADAWFDKHMVTCVVPRSAIKPEYLAALDKEPLDLDPWDALFGDV